MTFLPLDLSHFEKGGPGSGRHKETDEQAKVRFQAHENAVKQAEHHGRLARKAAKQGANDIANSHYKMQHEFLLEAAKHAYSPDMKKGLALVAEMMKGGPGSGRHKGGAQAAHAAAAMETGGNAERSKAPKKISPKERRANMAADSAALKEHGYTTTTGGYENKNSPAGAYIQPSENGHFVTHVSGAMEHVKGGKLKGVLDSIHGKKGKK